jgi:hypothetical protein
MAPIFSVLSSDVDSRYQTLNRVSVGSIVPLFDSALGMDVALIVVGRDWREDQGALIPPVIVNL